jgi:hypothetical protein
MVEPRVPTRGVWGRGPAQDSMGEHAWAGRNREKVVAKRPGRQSASVHRPPRDWLRAGPSGAAMAAWSLPYCFRHPDIPIAAKTTADDLASPLARLNIPVAQLGGSIKQRGGFALQFWWAGELS